MTGPAFPGSFFIDVFFFSLSDSEKSVCHLQKTSDISFSGSALFLPREGSREDPRNEIAF